MWWKLRNMHCKQDSFFHYVRDYLADRSYLIWVLLWAAAGYGFRLSHPIAGVDDVCIDLYFVRGLGVSIGRWPYYLMNKILPIGWYTPFLVDFVGVLLLIASAALWCGLLRCVLGRPIPTWAAVLFSGILVNYSLNAEVFVYYLHNGVGIASCLIPIALYSMMECAAVSAGAGAVGKQLPAIAGVVGLLTLAISFYESFAAVFLMGVCLLLLADELGAKRYGPLSWKKVLTAAGYTVAALICAMVLRSLITRLICGAVAEPLVKNYQMRSGTSSLGWLFQPGAMKKLLKILVMTGYWYGAVGLSSYTGLLLIVSTGVLLVSAVVLGIRKKQLLLPLLAAAALIASVCIGLFMGTAQPLRSCQTFPVLIGCVVLGVLLWSQGKNRWVRRVIAAAAVLMLCGTTLEMNNGFAANYELHTQETRVLENIAQELLSDYPVEEKPVAFVGTLEADYEKDPRLYIQEDNPLYGLIHRLSGEEGPYAKTQSMERSLLQWSTWAFSDIEGGYSVFCRLLARQGCRVIPASSDQSLEAEETSQDMPAYPKRGYIRETEDYIIVRLG